MRHSGTYIDTWHSVSVHIIQTGYMRLFVQWFSLSCKSLGGFYAYAGVDGDGNGDAHDIDGHDDVSDGSLEDRDVATWK